MLFCSRNHTGVWICWAPSLFLLSGKKNMFFETKRIPQPPFKPAGCSSSDSCAGAQARSTAWWERGLWQETSRRRTGGGCVEASLRVYGQHAPHQRPAPFRALEPLPTTLVSEQGRQYIRHAARKRQGTDHLAGSSCCCTHALASARLIRARDVTVNDPALVYATECLCVCECVSC